MTKRFLLALPLLSVVVNKDNKDIWSVDADTVSNVDLLRGFERTGVKVFIVAYILVMGLFLWVGFRSWYKQINTLDLDMKRTTLELRKLELERLKRGEDLKVNDDT